MRASEWQYLCAVHDPPKSCCAIDYCCHTLDWASSILTSQKHFPSRLTLGSESTGGTQQGVRQLTNVFRRVYRIFAHAWFQHRQVFWQVEGFDGLYIFFKTVCDFYALIPEDNYTIPPEAEGIAEDTASEKDKETEDPVVVGEEERGRGQMTILKRDDESFGGGDADTTTTISTGATTRRHKHTPSTGSAVTTIAEGDEEDKDNKDGSADRSVTEVEQTASDEVEGEEGEGAPTVAQTNEEPPAPIPETNETKDEANKNIDAEADPDPKLDSRPADDGAAAPPPVLEAQDHNRPVDGEKETDPTVSKKSQETPSENSDAAEESSTADHAQPEV